MVTSSHHFWFIYPVLAFSLTLGIQFIKIYFVPDKYGSWEQKEYQRELDKLKKHRDFAEELDFEDELDLDDYKQLRDEWKDSEIV